MTAVLDLWIDANILMAVAYGLWWGAQRLVAQSPTRVNHPAQLTLLKTVLVCLALSPLLAALAAKASAALWHTEPSTLSDMAVAAYLRGDLSLKAMELETLLSVRATTIEAVVEGRAPWLSALLATIALGGLVLLGRAVFTGVQLWHLLDSSHLWRRTARVDLRLSDTATVPFAARGLWRRYVVIPSDLLTRPKALRFVLAHEMQHLRQRDVEWELAFEVMRPLFYINPAFLLWRRAFERHRELSCDQSVILRTGIAPRAYAECLLSFCARRAAGPRALQVGLLRMGSAQAKRALRGRILALETAPMKLRRGVLIPSLAGVLTLAVATSATTIRQPSDWSQDRLMLSTIVNLERLRDQ